MSTAFFVRFQHAKSYKILFYAFVSITYLNKMLLKKIFQIYCSQICISLHDSSISIYAINTCLFIQHINLIKNVLYEEFHNLLFVTLNLYIYSEQF